MTDDERDAPDVLPPRYALGMTRGAFYAVIGLALFVIILAVANVYLWQDSAATKNRLHAQEEAQFAQAKAANIAKVGQCLQGIQFVAMANVIIDGRRGDLLNRAKLADRLAAVDPTKKLKDAHEAAAAIARKQARTLKDFPPVTHKQCAKLGRQLLGPDWERIVNPKRPTRTPTTSTNSGAGEQ